MDSPQKRERNRRKLDIRAAKAARRKEKSLGKRLDHNPPAIVHVNPGDPRLDPPNPRAERAPS